MLRRVQSPLVCLKASLAVGAAVGFGLGGCQHDNTLVIEIEGASGQAAIAEVAPTSLRIHPLTRVEVGPLGKPRLACHIELVDRFGHSVKWPLELTIELSSVGGSSGSGANQRFVKDLVTADDNAASYDWVTRTYVVLLGDLPSGSRLTLQASGRIPLPDGSVRTLTSSGDVLSEAK